MSKSSPGWNGMNLAGMSIRKFRDFETSWAGPGRTRGEFCLGSEDGRILFTDDQLNPVLGLKESPLTSPEAVNGVAFLPNLIAVSTRCEVAFATLQPVNGKGIRSLFPAGAHGVVATPSGHCVAPLGRGGLMVVKPSAGEYQPVMVKRLSHKPADFYRVVNISYAGGEILACAVRKDGVAVIPFSPGEADLVSSLTYPGLDVVDVCPLGERSQNPAVAAVSRDCTLILSRDAINDKKPTTLRFDEVQGVAYRVFDYHGNLLLLTSHAIYVMAGLSRRFLEDGNLGGTPIPVKAIVVEAVDANIVDGQSLLLVTPDGESLVALDQLVGLVPSPERPDAVREVNPAEIVPPWQPYRNDLESENSVMAEAV